MKRVSILAFLAVCIGCATTRETTIVQVPKIDPPLPYTVAVASFEDVAPRPPGAFRITPSEFQQMIVEELRRMNAFQRIVSLPMTCGPEDSDASARGCRMATELGAQLLFAGSIEEMEGHLQGMNMLQLPHALLALTVIGIPIALAVPNSTYDGSILVNVSVVEAKQNRIVASRTFRARAVATTSNYQDGFGNSSDERTKWHGVLPDLQPRVLNQLFLQLRQALLGEFGRTVVQSMKWKSGQQIAAASFSEPAREKPVMHAVPTPLPIRNVHVLVIGISSYQDPNIPNLKYTTPDAMGVYEFFKSAPESPAKPRNVHFLGDKPNEDGLRADKRGIMLAIDSYLVKKAVHDDDMAILYFAGHGDVGKHPTKGAEYYLIPQDAIKESMYATAIELSEFQRMWNAIPANTKILIADACNSGGFSGVRGMGGATGVESIKGEAKAVFSACRSDEKSIECDHLRHGLFTYVLLEGLKGKADRNNDERVALAELKRWLDRQVPLEARKAGGKQTPITSLADAWGDVYLTR